MKPSPSSTGKSSQSRLRNIFMVIILLTGFMFLLGLLSIFMNPKSSLNPFPSPILPPTVEIPTATATLHTLPIVWTPTPQDILGIGGPFSPEGNVPPTDTPSPIPTPQGGYPFGLQGSPAAISSSTFRTNSTCSWMGIGGRVYDLSNTPLKGYVIRLGGNINGVMLEEKFRLSGLDTIYGPSGFEFTLSNTPIQTVQSYWIRLEDQAGNPLTETIPFDTFADCKRNLILINFKQLH
jgi:hypothetical protein